MTVEDFKTAWNSQLKMNRDLAALWMYEREDAVLKK